MTLFPSHETNHRPEDKPEIGKKCRTSYQRPMKQQNIPREMLTVMDVPIQNDQDIVYKLI